MDTEQQDQPDQQLIDTIQDKARRRLRARREDHGNVWFGLGMFGIVGWSVTVPTMALLALGVWIDRRWPSGYSWTLMLLLLGVALGCANAWYWLTRERRLIEEAAEDHYD